MRVNICREWLVILAMYAWMTFLLWVAYVLGLLR